MDEKDKKIQELTNQLTTLTAEIATAKTALEKSQTDIKKLGEDLKAKDALIDQKNQDIIGARKQYKKLADMTKEEKEQMSEKEIQLQEQQERLDAEMEKFRVSQEDHAKRIASSTRSELIKKAVGDNPELVAKVEENFSKLKDSDKAMTAEEMQIFVDSSVNMLGELKPDVISDANNNAGGGAAPGEENTPGFAESKEGIDLSSKLGLPVETPNA